MYLCTVTVVLCTFMQCFILIEIITVKDEVVHIVITRCWLLLVTSMKCCHGNGNIGLHVCAKFHDHTQY